MAKVDAGQLHLHRVGETEDAACALPQEAVGIRLIDVEVVAQRANGHQPVHEEIIELDKKAERLDAGDSPGEGRADPVGQSRRGSTSVHLPRKICSPS